MAVSQTSHTAHVSRTLFVALALLAAFLLSTAALQRDSLWYDEAYTLYVVRDEGPLPASLPGVVRYVAESLHSALIRTRADVHPPLYFVLFDAWTLLTGESVYAARLLSVFFGLIALAGVYALGRRLFDARAGLMAAGVLGTASLFVYYSREARMYTLLMALAALATLAYLRWRDRPSVRRSLIYGLLLAALMYTHYAGALILLTHALHLLATRPQRVQRLILPGGLALLLYVPWIPSLLWQTVTHGGPAAPAFSDGGVAMAALVFFMTGGYGGVYLAPFLLGSALPRARQHADALALLLLWLLLTPILLWLLNRLIPSIFQVRYTLGILPAGALLVAYGLRWVGDLTSPPSCCTRLPLSIQWRGGWGVRWILLAVLLYTQLTLYPYIWPPKPHWDEAVRQMTATRQPLEPAITLIPAQGPAAYYDRVYGIRRGISLDLAWRWQEPADIANDVAHIGQTDSVWVVMPSTFVSTWDAVRDLLADRHVGYRDSVMDMIFYRFDPGAGDDLWFQLGDALNYRGGIRQQLYARPGEDFCFDLSFEALKDLPPGYAVDFALTQGYETVRAATTVELGARASGDSIDLAPCIPIPADNPAGPHHLHLRVDDQASGLALPLLEHGELYWSESLVFALVSVG